MTPSVWEEVLEEGDESHPVLLKPGPLYLHPAWHFRLFEPFTW